MKSDVDYAKVGGPPRDWTRLAVFEAATGREIKGVIEANAVDGWFIRYARNDDGKVRRDGPNKVTEYVEADILIQRTHGCGAPIRPPEGWTPSNHIAARDRAMPETAPRDPLRFTPPADSRPPHPWMTEEERRRAEAPFQIQTPEDGQRIQTPEGGKPITTRED